MSRTGECFVKTFLVVHSRCWTSQTPTARRTVRPHSSIRKTRGSTRRGWRPSWSRAGWTSELCLSPCSFLSITNSSSSQYFSLSFLPHQEKKTASISEELKCHLKKKRSREQPNGMRVSLLANMFEETRTGNQSYICFLNLLLLLHDVK